MTLYMIRHGQTDYNAEGRFQGQTDIPLNKTGEAQARQNGQRLLALIGEPAAQYQFISSPLARAAKTMEIIREELGCLTTDFNKDDRLAEISFGAWEGSTLEELRQTEPSLVAQRETDKWVFRPPGDKAETYYDVAARIKPVFDSLKKPAICVCHGVVIRAFLYNLGKSVSEIDALPRIPQDQVMVVNGVNFNWT